MKANMASAAVVELALTLVLRGLVPRIEFG
jgi:hypothetical protein